ncbi:MAG: squalene/phytoene synthase family protein [Wenzhouxiangella sp.]
MPLLSETTPADERKLIANCHQVIKVTHKLDERELAAVTRCLSVMTEGMHKYQRISGLHGLADIAQVDEYCYFVAGVVGEMLTELFCCYSPEIQSRRSRLMRLAPSFGQGLQMTNILKDVWEDHRRGTCWLPRSGFDADPGRIGDLLGQTDPQTYRDGMRTLISIAHFHLRNALDFTLLIPAHETGIRRFCLWAQGLAVLTLRKIHRHPDFTSGQEVKVTRRTVGLVVAVCSRCASHNRILRCLFASVSIGLPKGTSIVTCNWPTTFDAGSYDETAARGTLDIKK